MKTMTIDRGEHLTGAALKTLGSSGLFHAESGLMCCMGIYCKKAGMWKALLANEAMPGDLSAFDREVWNNDLAWLDKSLDAKDSEGRFRTVETKTVEWALAQTNDSTTRTRASRERALVYLFKKYGGIDLKFTGRAADAVAKAKKANEKYASR